MDHISIPVPHFHRWGRETILGDLRLRGCVRPGCDRAKIVGSVTVEMERDLLVQAREALVRTREHVASRYNAWLPPTDGWAWWDALRAIDAHLGLPHDDVVAMPNPNERTDA